jgi:hypothetical protein
MRHFGAAFFAVRDGAPKHSKALSSNNLRQLALCIAFITMGFHLGNYFWSGWAKLTLGPHFWSWAFLNHTQNLMLGAHKTRTLIFGHWPWITQQIFDAFGAVVIFSNVAVVVTQLFALFAPLRLRWITISSWCYDALHVGIFFIGALFFWPWIWNNLSIMLAARRSSDREVGWAPKICCILTILLGGWIGGSARLAWWDVSDFRTPTIQAEAEDGTWIDVPLSFFLSQAYAMGHAQENQAVTTGHYLPTDSRESTGSYDRVQSSGTCPTPPEIAEPESPAERAKSLDRFGRFLRAHHRKMLALADESGNYNFYVASLFHTPSNYWMNEKFNAMNIRKIKDYRLLTQSICYKVIDGHLVEHVVKEDTVVFDVGE